MQACKRVKFYFYTRSWRVAAIVPTIEAMAKRANCKVWYSTDFESGIPAVVPDGVRLAYLQTEAKDQPESARFAVHGSSAASFDIADGLSARDSSCGKLRRLWPMLSLTENALPHDAEGRFLALMAQYPGNPKG